MSKNRNKIESSGLLLDESIDYAVEQCNLLFEDWMKNRNNLDEANEVVAGFLDEYFIPQQLNYEIYSTIWTNLTDEGFLDGFVNFRLKNYVKSLEEIVDYSVQQYIIEKEYNDFINLLKLYIDSKAPELPFVNLIVYLCDILVPSAICLVIKSFNE